MKKLFAILLAVVMTFSMSVTVFADGEESNGTVTIENAIAKQTYSIYRIFDLESYNSDEEAYIYTVDAEWEEFINQDTIKGIYVNIDDSKHVTWVEESKNDKAVGEFAKLALEYAKEKRITAAASASSESHNSEVEVQKIQEGENAGKYTITFKNLKLGYYLVDSSTGALCALNTTAPNATMEEKNDEPTVEKTVKQDDNSYDESNDAQIGDKVEFKTVIHVKAGAQNYVLHDKMDNGLKFAEDSVKVQRIPTGQANGVEVTEDLYTVKTTELENTEPCDFHVTFKDKFYDNLQAGDQIVITYKATLTKDAVIGGEGNINKTWLDYGDSSHTTEDETKTYSYQFQIVKTDKGTGDTYTVLDGAKFELYTEENGDTALKLIKESEGFYRLATETDTEPVTEIEAGTPVIKGLDSKTYYLKETKAPDGFNKLTERVKVTIDKKDNLVNDSALNNITENEIPKVTYTTSEDNPGGGLHVQNSKGNMLPSTGGIGTTIFYVVGGILVLGAGAGLILISRRGRKPADK